MRSETSKARAQLSNFCNGYGLDIGFGGDKIVPHAIALDLNRPYTKVGFDPVQLGGDCRNLRWFTDECLDFVYSSHLLEDFKDTVPILKEWVRVLKCCGYLILLLPDEMLYREHCRKIGEKPNEHHTIDNFNANYIKNCMDQVGGMKLWYEKKFGYYNFGIVYRKMISKNLGETNEVIRKMQELQRIRDNNK